MSNEKKSMKESILWNSAGSMFYLACQWVLTILVVRMSGVEDAGILSLAMSVSNIWFSISLYGMRNYQASDTVGKYKEHIYILSRVLTSGFALLGCFLYVLVMPYDSKQKICIILYFGYKLSEAMADVFAGIFQKNWRLDYAGKSFAIRGVITIVFFVGIFWMTKNLPVTLAFMAFGCMSMILIYDRTITNKLVIVQYTFDWKKVIELLKECLPLVVYTLLATFISTIPRLLMERILGNYYLGIYGAVAAPTLIIQVGAQYIFSPFVTLFAERYNNRQKDLFVSALKKCVLAVLALSILGMIGGKLFGRLGLLILYGEEVAEYTELLIPLILCTILTAFTWLLSGILTVMREFKGLVIGNVIAVVCSCVLSVVLEKMWGMQGASVALGVATFVEIAVLVVFMKKKMKTQFEILNERG